MVSDPILAVGLVMVVRFIRGSAAAAIQLPRITGDNETPQIGEIIFNALLASTALNMLFPPPLAKYAVSKFWER